MTADKRHRSSFISYALLALMSFYQSGCALGASRQLHSLTRLKNITRGMSLIDTRRSHLSQRDRVRIANIAKRAVGKSRIIVNKKPFRADCSGTVRAIFASAKVALGGIIKSRDENDVKAIYRYVQKYGQVFKDSPQAGDLVFFHNTYDRSRNGQMNDALTHIGIVEKLEGSTIYFIHHLGRAIIRSRMDLSLPKSTFHPKTHARINHILRRPQGIHKAYTAAELFAAFGRL